MPAGARGLARGRRRRPHEPGQIGGRAGGGGGVRRILVTGASGFVGRRVLPALRREFPGAELLAATRGARPPGWDGSVALDLAGHPAGARSAVAAAAPDAVVHLAAAASVGASFGDPLGTWRVNAMGTVSLAEAVLGAAPGAVFLLASSAEVYGLSFRDAAGPLAEDAPLRPANPYAASKAAADLAVGEMALRGLRAVRLRPFNQIGPGQSEDFVVAAFARQIARVAAGLQDPAIRVGALDRWRDFVDVDDVARAYALALRAARDGRVPAGAAFNIASGAARRVGAVLDELCALAGVSPAVVTEPGRLRPTDVPRTEGSAAAARAAFGWSPAVPWRDTLGHVLSDWRARTAGSP